MDAVSFACAYLGSTSNEPVSWVFDVQGALSACHRRLGRSTLDPPQTVHTLTVIPASAHSGVSESPVLSSPSPTGRPTGPTGRPTGPTAPPGVAGRPEHPWMFLLVDTLVFLLLFLVVARCVK
jgi:hypothetical protein